MDYITVLGLAAGFFTTFATAPQIYRTIKKKETDDISLLMYVMLSVGILLWIIYGVMKSDIPVIVANSISLVLNCTVLGFKLRYG